MRRVPVHCWHNALVVQRARAVVVCPRLCPAGPRVLVSRTVKMQLHVNEHTMPALCWDRTSLRLAAMEFTLKTRDRSFVIAGTSASETAEWISVLTGILNRLEF